jgi:hypothetical protein
VLFILEGTGFAVLGTRMPIEKGSAKDPLTSSEKLLPCGEYFVGAKVLATKTP